MNLLLFSRDELSAGNLLQLAENDRRSQHIRSVLKLRIGDQLRVGELNGLMGLGILQSDHNGQLTLSIKLETPPPPPLDLTMILALPRPKMMRRVIQNVAAMGVKTLYLINAAKVEKSYWQTPWLSTDSLLEQSLLGLEQAGDTLLPTINQRKLFKPFVEDELPGLLAQRSGWVAHPGSGPDMPDSSAPLLLAIGPEGGFTEYEVGKLKEAGCRDFSFGPRILRVETAIPAILGRLYL